MYLEHISLQNFRNYTKRDFSLSRDTTFIVGPNTTGKTNLLEAIFLLSTGASFRTEFQSEMIRFGENIGRVHGKIFTSQDRTEARELEIIITSGEINGKKVPIKKYLVNKVAKRRIDFVGNLLVVVFSPIDLSIVIGAPSMRRNFLDEVLEAVDLDYRRAGLNFAKGLRQRNALLEKTKATGVRNEKQFEYWDNILIANGEIITWMRGEFIEFVNKTQKDIFDFIVLYNKSVISKERLLKYQNAEIASGVTLVGPHRDDFSIQMFNNIKQTTHDIKLFGSRGQQRLAVLQLKLLQLLYIEEKLKEHPILLLDDIFSELDEEHIKLVLGIIGDQQTIITTTHKEFIPKEIQGEAKVIELKG